MNDAILKFGSVWVYGFGVLSVFSFLWGSFVFHKKAAESHFNEHSILDAVVLSAFWAVIIGRIVYALLNISIFWNHLPRIFLLTDYPGIDKWGVIIGISTGLLIESRKSKAKYFDWFDFLALGVTAGMAVFYGGLGILSGRWQFGLLSLLVLLAFIVFWGMENKYRTFAWYRSKKTSAKSGFIGGSLISIWGLLSIIEMILFGKMNLVAVLWGVSMFVGGIVMVYIRSGRTVAEDIKIIFKHGKK